MVVYDDAFRKCAKVVIDLFFDLKFVLSTMLGWCFLGMSFLFTTFGDKAMLFHYVLAVLAADLFFGAWSSLILKRFKISIALYSTAVKLILYFTLFYMPLIMEKILSNNSVGFGTVIVTALLCAAEFFSICAHMLIIKPDLWVVKILRNLLAGEMAHKLGMKVEELEQYFENRKNGN